MPSQYYSFMSQIWEYYVQTTAKMAPNLYFTVQYVWCRSISMHESIDNIVLVLCAMNIIPVPYQRYGKLEII